MGIGKIQSGSIARRQTVMQIKRDGAQVSAKVSDLSVFAGLERMEVEKADAGEIVAVAGISDIGIGETIADANDPIALPPVTIDEPTVQMTFAVNNSPFAGREGKYLTSRHLRERLFKELETNVSLRVNETDSPDRFLVAGRGELHLAVLIEQMRREGYELQVSQPEVIMRQENGVTTEPYEDLSIEVPSGYQGSVIEEVGQRRGELRHMKVIHSEGNISDTHMEFSIPTRGVIGLKNVLLAKTRGTVIMHHVFHRYEPVDPRLVTTAAHGSLVAFEDGTSNAYGLYMIQERGTLFIGPSVDVYRGMVVGQNSRDEDLDVNICKAKQLSNMRASGSDEALVLTPPRQITLEYALEYIGTDELVEITPSCIRIRKRLLNPEDRRKARKGRS
jgi:GTP-binding protein